MNVSTLAVLLVCLIFQCAHAASFQWGRDSLPLRSKRSTSKLFSVVEDWTSVCEEVCSTEYGGPGCGAHCFPHATIGPNSHTVLLSNALSGMCSLLCQNNLGYKCNCASISISPSDETRNRLCSKSCSWRSPLKGCSPCSSEPIVKKSSDERLSSENAIPDDETTVDDRITTEDDDSATIDDESTTDDISTSEEGVTDEDDSSEEDSTTKDDSTTEEATTESTTITTTTTTTTQPTTTTTRTTTPGTTTPNWEAMCEALCRNGEGGSFCNCDIPPFF